MLAAFANVAAMSLKLFTTHVVVCVSNCFICYVFEFGAVQKCANFVEHEKCREMNV